MTAKAPDRDLFGDPMSPTVRAGERRPAGWRYRHRRPDPLVDPDRAPWTRQQELADLARQWGLSAPQATDRPAVEAFLAEVRARRNRAEHQQLVDATAARWGIPAPQVGDEAAMSRFHAELRRLNEEAGAPFITRDRPSTLRPISELRRRR